MLLKQTVWLASFIRVSDEQWENDQVSFKMSEDIRIENEYDQDIP